ncbi:MAG: hypothetical protein HC809_02690 [Gammaproteobacteria bacterium]|nr:hypothetical protein [Gammaproteobacteria bacterium]
MLAALWMTWAALAAAPADAVAAPLTALPGDAVRGAAIVFDRRTGNCLMCHRVPGNEPFQGDMGPDLRGVGARLNEGQIRLRLIDQSRTIPNTVMPPYFRTEDLIDVAPSTRRPGAQRATDRRCRRLPHAAHGRIVPSRRRSLIAMVGAAFGSIAARCIHATPQMRDDAITAITQSAPVNEGRVTLTIPGIAENGLSVYTTVTVDSPLSATDFVRAIHIIAEQNPIARLVTFNLGPHAGGGQGVNQHPPGSITERHCPG